MIEKKTECELYAYKKSKWARDIDISLLALAADLKSGKPDAGKSLEYIRQERWTIWMMQEGYKKTDQEIAEKTCEILPEISKEQMDYWIKVVNEREDTTTSAQKLQ